MPFKIVQTIEDGENCLSVVPAKWECNGVLFWPKKCHFGKLSRNGESLPDEKKWERMNCVKKREYETRKEAEAELERMEEKSDTEIDDRRTVFQTGPSLKRDYRGRTKRVQHEEWDYNCLIPSAASASCDYAPTQNVPQEKIFAGNIEMVSYT